MLKKKDVLTTGQVAQICSVAPRTVTKWFDCGQLKGYRIPGSRDRRIPACELVRFLKANNMPTDSLEAGQMRILILDSDGNSSEAMVNALQGKGSFSIYTATSGFDAGLIAQKVIPQIMMINLMSNSIDAGQICANIRSYQDLCDTKIIALANGLNLRETEALQKKGFDAVLTMPADVSHVIQLMYDLTSII